VGTGQHPLAMAAEAACKGRCAVEASLRFPRGTTIIRSPILLLSEALGAPGSPQRTWDDNDLFPLLSARRRTCMRLSLRSSTGVADPRGYLTSAESATNPRVPHPPGFPVRLGGVNEPHAAFLKRKPHTLPWLGPRSRKSGVLRAFGEGWDTTNLDTDLRVSHPLQRTQRMGHPSFRGASRRAKYQPRLERGNVSY
jgi:hypothetical protein